MKESVMFPAYFELCFYRREMLHQLFFYLRLIQKIFGLSETPLKPDIYLNIIWNLKGTLSLRVKRPSCEADHSPPSSDEVKKTRICTSTPLHVFMECDLINYEQGQLYLTLTFENTLSVCYID
jgi:hypothetical protein